MNQFKSKLKQNVAFVQYPIGIEGNLKGVVDLVEMKAYYNEGEKGEVVKEAIIPQEMIEKANEKRQELIAALADVDENIGDAFINETEITNAELKVFNFVIHRKQLDPLR